VGGLNAKMDVEMDASSSISAVHRTGVIWFRSQSSAATTEF
jgi:hypothetical protein